MSKFKVGDKVRVIDTPPKDRYAGSYFPHSMDVFLGTEHEVGEVHMDKRYSLLKGRGYFFDEGWLTLIESTAKEPIFIQETNKPSFNYKFAYRELKLYTECIQEMMENSDVPAKHFSQFLEKGLKAAVEMGKMTSMIENWEDGE